MKFWNNLLKFLAGLAAVAGIVYVVVTYGDKIVAWAKKTFGKYCCCGCCEDEIPEVPAEEAAAEEEIPAENVAEEADFEG